MKKRKRREIETTTFKKVTVFAIWSFVTKWMLSRPSMLVDFFMRKTTTVKHQNCQFSCFTSGTLSHSSSCFCRSITRRLARSARPLQKKTSLFTLIIFVLFCSYLIITGINDLSLKPKHYLNCWTSLWALFKVVSIRFTASLIQKLFIQMQNETIVRQGRRRTERDEAKFILKNIKKLTKIKYFYSLVYFFQRI